MFYLNSNLNNSIDNSLEARFENDYRIYVHVEYLQFQCADINCSFTWKWFIVGNLFFLEFWHG